MGKAEGGFFADNIETPVDMRKFTSSPVPSESGSQHLPSFSVETIHLSCQSDAYQGTDYGYAGVIIYSCDGKSEWQTANGTRCKSGYLVIMDTGTEKVKKYQEKSPGLVHGAVYRSAFGEECTARQVNAEGFSVMKGELKINSSVFNPAKDGYHDDKRTMHPESARCVRKVIKSWKNAGESFRNRQNFAVKDLLSDEQQVEPSSIESTLNSRCNYCMRLFGHDVDDADNIVTRANMGEFTSSPVPSESGSQHLPSFPVQTIHISCQSDSYEGTDNRYAGVIIYSCDGKSEWQTANGTRCKTVFLVIMDTETEKVKKFQQHSPGQVHGAIYRSAFGEECTARHVNAEGFSVMNGEFKINSGVFNPAKDGYHDDKRTMHPVSARCVEKVIESWKNAGESFRNCKNFAVKDLLSDEQQVEPSSIESTLNSRWNYHMRLFGHDVDDAFCQRLTSQLHQLLIS